MAYRWGLVLAAAQTVSALAALAQGYGGIAVGGWVAEDGRSPGLAGHPNILGLMSGIVVVLCVAQIVNKGSLRRGAAIIAMINMGALLACGSISALLSLGLGVLVLLVAKRVRPLPVLTVATVAAGLIWFTATAATLIAPGVRSPLDRILQVTGQTTATGTLELRQLTIQYAWERIRADPWFGAGLDDSSGGTIDGSTVTHNILLRGWFQGGISLAIAFACLFAVIAYVVWVGLRNGTHGEATGVLVVVAAFALTSAALQQGYFWFPVLGCLAVIAPNAAKASPIPAGVSLRRYRRSEYHDVSVSGPS